MYSKLPNLVFGFHGCDKEVFDKVVKQGQKLKKSQNDYDWLGNGIYFWEQNYDRAMKWAREQAGRGAVKTPAVIGAIIDLGHCLNLTDSRYIDLLEEEYLLMAESFDLAKMPLPKNEGRTNDKLLRKLDCAVVQHLHARLEQEWQSGAGLLEPFDSVRGLFSEGDQVYPGAGFKKKTHVQICVRNPNCIKGFFDPRKPDSKWKIP